MKRAREQAEDEAQSKPTSNSPLRRPSHLSCRTATAEVEAGTPSRPAAPRPTAAEGSQPASEGARTGAGSRRVSTRHLEGLAGQQQANFLSSADVVLLGERDRQQGQVEFPAHSRLLGHQSAVLAARLREALAGAAAGGRTAELHLGSPADAMGFLLQLLYTPREFQALLTAARQDQIEGLLLLCRHNGMAALARRVEALLCGLPDEEQGLAVDCQWQPLQAVANDPMGWLLLAERCAAPLLSQCCVNLLAQFLISAAKGRSLLTPMALLQSDHRFREMPLETLGRVMDAVLLALRAAKDDLDLALLPELVPSPAFPRPWTHTGGHRWVIQNWFSIPRDEISTEALSLAGYACQLWIYPAGAPAGNGGSPGHLGFSLRFCDQDLAKFEAGFHADLQISVVNQRDPAASITKSFKVEEEPGKRPRTAMVVRFCALEKLGMPQEGGGGQGPFVVDDTLVVELQLEAWTAEKLAARFRRRAVSSGGKSDEGAAGAACTAASSGLPLLPRTL